MKKFRIHHRDLRGVDREYDGLFKCSIDAIKDCIATFGIGRIKVVAL